MRIVPETDRSSTSTESRSTDPVLRFDAKA
jgi:hypothetical protein